LEAQIDLLRMVEVGFLTLVLSLLHLGQATTCQGDDCPTGLIITGGQEAETSIETFPANCMNIPPFPAPGRFGHTLSVVENGRQLVVCGGGSTETSCISWIRGQDEWTHYATLSQERILHAAVSIKERIFILGGVDNSMKTGEIVGDGGRELTLQNSGWATCALVWEDGFLTIGGYGNSVWHGKVDRYDSEGKYKDSLPDLATPRSGHGCTSFITNGEQALLVAGGWDGSARLASTEIYSNGVWRPGGNLPRAMSGLRAAHLNQQAAVTGGIDDENNISDEVLQYNPSNNTWSKMGTMKKRRVMHAVTEVYLDGAGCIGESTSSATSSATSRATTTTGLDPLLALLTCLVLVCCRRCEKAVSGFQ